MPGQPITPAAQHHPPGYWYPVEWRRHQTPTWYRRRPLLRRCCFRHLLPMPLRHT